MNVPLHLEGGERESFRFRGRDGQTRSRAGAVVLQFFNEFLAAGAWRRGREKLSERRKRLCVNRFDLQTLHQATSQGCSFSQCLAISKRWQIQTFGLLFV